MEKIFIPTEEELYNIVCQAVNDTLVQNPNYNQDIHVCDICPQSLIKYVEEKSKQALRTFKYQGIFNNEAIAKLCLKAYLFGIAVSHCTQEDMKNRTSNLAPYNDYIK